MLLFFSCCLWGYGSSDLVSEAVGYICGYLVPALGFYGGFYFLDIDLYLVDGFIVVTNHRGRIFTKDSKFSGGGILRLTSRLINNISWNTLEHA